MPTSPTTGGFKDGRGEFHAQEDFDGRAVLVRFVITPLDEDGSVSSRRSPMTAAGPGR